LDYSNFGLLKIPTEAGLICQQQWQEGCAEVNPNMWTKGIIELYRNYFLKNESPDACALRTRASMGSDQTAFDEFLATNSIEGFWKG
jgi:hypothetical protein